MANGFSWLDLSKFTCNATHTVSHIPNWLSLAPQDPPRSVRKIPGLHETFAGVIYWLIN